MLWTMDPDGSVFVRRNSLEIVDNGCVITEMNNIEIN